MYTIVFFDLETDAGLLFMQHRNKRTVSCELAGHRRLVDRVLLHAGAHQTRVQPFTFTTYASRSFVLLASVPNFLKKN